ncbi:hypothetical protein VKT23_016862 [Stygiomarasmius scandens]|uniref:Uncharacterized protein n=1 Tax=Marasmiellus scandens TaxID=2682957 RepID=A0ABR1IXZ9_9AGAR
MLNRERRFWTAHEDQLLREAVEIEDPCNPNPSKWHAISKHVPNRTNKDCRKRWFATMASEVVKGGWSPEEDDRLVKAIEKFGTRWSMVSSMVQTRNSDQCAKRWTDTLNPTIDRTSWTPESDALLIKAVQEHGKFWTKIVKTYFPGRTGLSAKNRYNSLTRNLTGTDSGGSRQQPSLPSHRRDSVSSSSASASPVTPSSAVEDPSTRSALLTPPELSLDSNTWPSYSSACTGKTAAEHFTYEELISALLPLHNEQEQLSMHQNLDIPPETYAMPFPTTGASSGYSCNENAYHSIPDQFSFDSGSSQGSFNTRTLPATDQDPQNEELFTAIRNFTLDSTMNLDTYNYMFNHRETSPHTASAQFLHMPVSDSPRSRPQVCPVPNSNPANRSPSCICMTSRNTVDAFWRPEAGAPFWEDVRSSHSRWMN